MISKRFMCFQLILCLTSAAFTICMENEGHPKKYYIQKGQAEPKKYVCMSRLQAEFVQRFIQPLTGHRALFEAGCVISPTHAFTHDSDTPCFEVENGKPCRKPEHIDKNLERKNIIESSDPKDGDIEERKIQAYLCYFELEDNANE